MNAIERIEKLKTARRAELATAEAARKRREEEEAVKAVAAWNRDVIAALVALDCEWLAEFRAKQDGEPHRFNTFTVREAWFSVPGHRQIVLRMHEVNHYDPQWDSVATVRDIELWATSANGLQESDSLADVLIAAEGDPPIPF